MALHSHQSRLPRATWARRLSQPTLVAAGQEWDAIRVEADIGVRAVRFLEASGTPVGPVLHDQGSGQAYFLTPPGTAQRWQQDQTHALGEGSWVVLAPSGWEGGLLRWVSDPADGPAYTAAGDLTIALTVAAGGEISR
ncbi:hypothetical protein StrepF001_16640 [Streptomyces sp. F001]|uniref:hypothetical protein n=1 Tax=Streptomyces sp. F001 TaxID=1510026 RepID=UPI00101E51DB|nr:hypothetical protein [Streptomyces sp. F001]RZB18654.1 hypothetical protein StrepF001_16640 [Streptomyces sp. F001]